MPTTEAKPHQLADSAMTAYRVALSSLVVENIMH